ncbi:putative disease resistance protein RGA1 [Papaver somniferum]|uniref:putative disease resistance protein RGA1 n=1 Tax=Papaver somniferum TaxID=3469 RepID=UPI000E703475|nr:putative disease resistance protein RGA1 [Papaver somniferum]
MAIERILINGVTELLKNFVIPVVAKNIGFTSSLKNDLRKLRDTLEMILAKIADAEEKQEKSNELRLWLKRLKDVSYDADDVMDELSYETMRRSERESFKYKARDFFSSSNPVAYRRKLTKQIKEINILVDEIAKDVQKFQLQTMNNPASTIANGGSSEQRNRQTASSIIDSEIVGRKDDKKKIIDLLTKATASSSGTVNQFLEKVPIISIVGMGGLGKTTLAQLVYNDKWVIEHFDTRIWVCVSNFFDVETVLIKIMESITLAKFHSVSNFDLLVNKVQDNLQDTKFLLVLDDLWNENILQWERLKNLLLVASQGSKILITTRRMQVADVVKGSIRPYHLEELQEHECWSIMEKRAFSPGGALKTPNMTTIGMEMANKCSGLPLAAKLLGSLMHLKNKESDWLSITETGLWNTQEGQSQMRPILKLSYDNLTPHLKQCFSYCSIFPKGWEINKETLIQLWISEGFLESSSSIGNERSIEDIGEEYFDSLVRSSFLDGVEKNDLDDIITCKMHDLVHDLARDTVGNCECATVKVSKLENISDVRRLQLISDDELPTARPRALSELKKLRTIIILEPNYGLKDYSFSRNKKLRVLHFGPIAGGCKRIRYPAANKLKHLRYFYLSNLNLSGMRRSDQYISKLYNLHTLVLKRCGSVQNLLKNMRFLKNLRFLDISFTDIKELPDSLTSLNLQKLDISHCNSLTNFPNSATTGLKHLKFLDMSFTPIEELPGFIINLHNLQTFNVNSCKKLKSLPEYVAGLANLRIFNFKECTLLEEIPKDFGALTQLRYLNFYGTEIKVLPESCANLHNLDFVDLFKCELPKDVTNWTKLRKFVYFQPRNQIILGVGKLVCLETLVYSVPEKLINGSPECNVGIEELRNLNILEDLTIVNLENVKDPTDAKKTNLKEKHNLRELLLGWGEIEEELGMMKWDHKSCNFQVFEALEPPSSLRYLNIQNFMGCDLPTWMSRLPELEFLVLINCSRIKKLPASIGQLSCLKCLDLTAMTLKSLHIGGFPSLIQLDLTDMFNLEELSFSYPSCLQHLSIKGCKRLTEIPSFPCLMQLLLHETDHKLVCSVVRSQASLTELFLENIDELVYFPVSTCNLQVLQIKECNQFEGFGVNNDENENNAVALCNSSLQRLALIDCPVLRFLPDLRGSTSLRKLAIWNCPKVKKSLTYDLRCLSFLKMLHVDFIQRDDKRGDPSTHEELINLLW